MIHSEVNLVMHSEPSLAGRVLSNTPRELDNHRSYCGSVDGWSQLRLAQCVILTNRADGFFYFYC